MIVLVVVVWLLADVTAAAAVSILCNALTALCHMADIRVVVVFFMHYIHKRLLMLCGCVCVKGR